MKNQKRINWEKLRKIYWVYGGNVIVNEEEFNTIWYERRADIDSWEYV